MWRGVWNEGEWRGVWNEGECGEVCGMKVSGGVKVREMRGNNKIVKLIREQC